MSRITPRSLASAVFFDMSKAFDIVNLEPLSLKLQDVGTSNSVIQWFCSYLNDRQQVVRIHSTLSEQHCPRLEAETKGRLGEVWPSYSHQLPQPRALSYFKKLHHSPGFETNPGKFLVAQLPARELCQHVTF